MNLSSLNACELIALASSLSISISNQFSPDEVAVLSAFFTTLGDNLALALTSNN